MAWKFSGKSDVYVQIAEKYENYIKLGVLKNGEKLYFCDGYTLTLQILDGGDWSRTVQTLCGYLPEKKSFNIGFRLSKLNK